MFPAFQPHPLLPGGHAQTLAGVYLPAASAAYRAVPHRLELDDGDATVLHEDRGAGWATGAPLLLLVHGLAGCHMSPYMVRIAEKACEFGWRVFRMDLRNCGAASGLSVAPYHAGCSDDILAAVRFLAERHASSPMAAVGFSLSGNMVLKLVGECGDDLPAQLRCVAAVNPPIDLAASTRRLQVRLNRFYDRHFVRLLCRQVQDSPRLAPQFAQRVLSARPRKLWDFDDLFTAPAAGFSGADDYYARASAQRFVHGIRRPTLVLTARNDPLVPIECFERQQWPDAVHLHLARHGGHLGYVGRGGCDADRRWMDWRILEWIRGQLSPT
jgi:predicted alpha/beta-fold hydrolase